MNNSLDKAVQKIYEKIALTGECTDNQLMLILLCEKQNKPSTLSYLINNADKIGNLVVKIFPSWGGNE